MLTRTWATTIINIVLLGTLIASTDADDCSKFAPPHHLYKNASGQYCCARHRRPLITGHVFSMSSPLPIIDFYDEMRRVSDCNPNSSILMRHSIAPRSSVKQVYSTIVPTARKPFLRPQHE